MFSSPTLQAFNMLMRLVLAAVVACMQAAQTQHLQHKQRMCQHRQYPPATTLLMEPAPSQSSTLSATTCASLATPTERPAAAGAAPHTRNYWTRTTG
mgnify:CR=1 FL=1